MMAALREWLTSVTVVMLLITLVQTLVPEGTLRSIAAFAGGLVLLAVLIQPLPGTARITAAFRASEYAMELKEQRQALEAFGTASLGEEIARLTATAIEEKASALGVHVTAEVATALDESGTPVPCSVILEGEYLETLAEWMQDTLGIPAAFQTWK